MTTTISLSYTCFYFEQTECIFQARMKKSENFKAQFSDISNQQH